MFTGIVEDVGKVKEIKIKSKEIPSALYPRAGDVKLQSYTDGWKNFKFLLKKRVQ